MEWKILKFDEYNLFEGYLDGYLNDPDYLFENYIFKNNNDIFDSYQRIIEKYEYYLRQNDTPKNISRRNLNFQKKELLNIFITKFREEDP